MNYFDGIEFIFHGDCPAHEIVIRNRQFNDYYGIQYNHSGQCDLTIDGEDFHLDSGSGFFTGPGHTYSYGAPKGKKRHHMFICFRGERIQKFIDGGLFSPNTFPPVFKLHNPEKFHQNLLELQNLLRYPSSCYNARKTLLLEDILLQIVEQPERTRNLNPLIVESIDQLRNEIADTPQKDWDFAGEAKKISISYPHFRKLFRQITGLSPNNFLIECRLNMAAGLLLGTLLPINEIAHACGYQDEFYFYRLFRQRRFCTASEYRKKSPALFQ